LRFENLNRSTFPHVPKPLLLKPLATAEFLVAQKEIEGGSGANFMVKWVSDTQVNEPVIETVMIGIESQTSISFVRAGIASEEKKRLIGFPKFPLTLDVGYQSKLFKQAICL